MKNNQKASLTILTTLSVVTILGVLLFMGPLASAAADSSGCVGICGSASGYASSTPLDNPLGSWSLSITSGAITSTTSNGLVQGNIQGVFTLSGLGYKNAPVTGTWNYVQSNGIMFLKLSGNGLTISISVLMNPTLSGSSFFADMRVSGMSSLVFLDTSSSTNNLYFTSP